MSGNKYQLTTGPMPLEKVGGPSTTGEKVGTTKVAEVDPKLAQKYRLDKAMALSAQLLREALDRWGDRKTACYHMGITERVLSSWTRGVAPIHEHRLWLMPPTFHEIHGRLKSQHFGLTKLRLVQMIDAIGNLDTVDERYRVVNE